MYGKCAIECVIFRFKCVSHDFVVMCFKMCMRLIELKHSHSPKLTTRICLRSSPNCGICVEIWLTFDFVESLQYVENRKQFEPFFFFNEWMLPVNRKFVWRSLLLISAKIFRKNEPILERYCSRKLFSQFIAYWVAIWRIAVYSDQMCICHFNCSPSVSI